MKTSILVLTKNLQNLYKTPDPICGHGDACHAYEHAHVYGYESYPLLKFFPFPWNIFYQSQL